MYKRQGDLVHILDTPKSFLVGLAWSPDSACVAKMSENNVIVWDAAAGVSIRVLRGGPIMSRWGMCVAWSLVGSMLAAAYDDHAVRVWDAVTGTVLQTFQGPGKLISVGPR